MKNLLKTLLIGLILTSCSFNKKEIIILKTLDQFDSQAENEQLGVDILSYNFQVSLKQELPDLTQTELNNITYQYFISSSDKQVSFRLILSNEAIAKKDKITSLFQKIVDEQVVRQVNDKVLFDKAIKLTKEYLELLDKYDFDTFWKNTSKLMRNITTKENFFSNITDREKINQTGGERIFQSKQYYRTFPNTKDTSFYVINYKFEKEKNMMEQIVFQLEDNELKIAGYTGRLKN